MVTPEEKEAILVCMACMKDDCTGCRYEPANYNHALIVLKRHAAIVAEFERRVKRRK